MTVSPLSAFGRRIRLGLIGGGGVSLIGPTHRIAARLDDHFEICASVLSSDPSRSLAEARALRIPRGYTDVPTMIAEEAKRPGDFHPDEHALMKKLRQQIVESGKPLPPGNSTAGLIVNGKVPK